MFTEFKKIVAITVCLLMMVGIVSADETVSLTPTWEHSLGSSITASEITQDGLYSIFGTNNGKIYVYHTLNGTEAWNVSIGHPITKIVIPENTDNDMFAFIAGTYVCVYQLPTKTGIDIIPRPDASFGDVTDVSIDNETCVLITYENAARLYYLDDNDNPERYIYPSSGKTFNNGILTYDTDYFYLTEAGNNKLYKYNNSYDYTINADWFDTDYPYRQKLLFTLPTTHSDDIYYVPIDIYNTIGTFSASSGGTNAKLYLNNHGDIANIGVKLSGSENWLSLMEYENDTYWVNITGESINTVNTYTLEFYYGNTSITNPVEINGYDINKNEDYVKNPCFDTTNCTGWTRYIEGYSSETGTTIYDPDTYAWEEIRSRVENNRAYVGARSGTGFRFTTYFTSDSFTIPDGDNHIYKFNIDYYMTCSMNAPGYVGVGDAGSISIGSRRLCYYENSDIAFCNLSYWYNYFGTIAPGTYNIDLRTALSNNGVTPPTEIAYGWMDNIHIYRWCDTANVYTGFAEEQIFVKPTLMITESLTGNVQQMDYSKIGDWLVVSTDSRFYTLMDTGTTFSPIYSSENTGTVYDVIIGDGGAFSIEGRDIITNIYKIDAEKTALYTTGGSVTTVDIAKGTCLWAISGSNDGKVYIYSKDESSNWYVYFNSVSSAQVTTTKISDNGYYAIVGRSNGNILFYNIDAYVESGGDDPTTVQDFSANAIIYKNGIPYSYQAVNLYEDITLNDNWTFVKTAKTDSNGYFTFNAISGHKYKVVVNEDGGEREGYVEYFGSTSRTTFTLNIKVDVIQHPYSYSAEYREEDGSSYVDYTYTDVDPAYSVKISIYDTDIKKLIFTHTYLNVTEIDEEYLLEQSGSYKVDFEIKRTISGVAIRDTKYVSAIPTSAIPIEIDGNIKNVMFVFILMIFAGIFSAFYAEKGALAVIGIAAFLRYMEFITIDWGIITVIGFFVIVANLMRR